MRSNIEVQIPEVTRPDASGRALFLYASPDSGHRACSDAVRKALERLAPKMETAGVDTISALYPTLGPLIEKTYLEILKYTPQIWSFLYDNPEIEEITRELRQMFSFFNQPKVKNILTDYDPSVFVCTHAIPCGIVAEQKRRGLCDLPLVAIVTDFAVHSYWIHPEVDLYLVANDESRQTLIARGIDAARVKVSGIPVDPAFSEKHIVWEARQQLALEEKQPVILLMGGARGLGPIAEMAEQILQVEPEPQLLIVAGLNKELERQLGPLVERDNVHLYSYTQDIPLLMNAADIIVTKPGGLTSSEALIKELPMVIVNPIPGQEERNSNYLIAQKAALRVQKVKNLKRLLERMLARPDWILRMTQNARAIAKPNSAETAARAILHLLRTRKLATASRPSKKPLPAFI